MIKEKPKVIKIVKKKTVVVECHVLSKFTPECTWFKETQAVKQDTRHKVHVEQVKEVCKGGGGLAWETDSSDVVFCRESLL